MPSIFDIQKIRDHIISYCGTPWWIVTVEYTQRNIGCESSFIVGGKPCKEDFEFTLDQYYGESGQLYEFIDATYEQIYDKENYIYIKYNQSEEEYFYYCFETDSEFYGKAGRMYESYSITEEIDEWDYIEEDFDTEEEFWNFYYSHCLYKIAVYSHRW